MRDLSTAAAALGRAALAAGALAACCACPAPVQLEDDWTAMGQPARAEVHMATERDAAEVMEQIRSGIARVEALMDFRDEDSVLAQVNRSAAEGFHTIEDREVYRSVLLALDYAKASHGAFDPTVAPLLRLYQRAGGRPPTPSEIAIAMERVGWSWVTVAEEARAVRFRKDRMELDLGGIAKGFAIDVAARSFAGRRGSHGGLLRIGGNLYAWGAPAQREEWSIDVPDPREPGRPLLTLRSANRGVAVSGHAARGRPRILDPRTGMPAASDLRVAMAVADSAADADALSTALFVAGSMAGADLLSRTNRVEAVLLVGGSGPARLLASASLSGRIEPSPELAAEVGDRIRFLLPPETIAVELPER